MDPVPPGSKRARKRLIQEGVRALLRQPGWDPRRRVPDADPLAGPRGALEAARLTEVSIEADACPECQRQRAREGDESALCARHLTLALGLDPRSGA